MKINTISGMTVKGEFDIHEEDGGLAKIATVYGDPNQENGVFVRIQSWDIRKKHLQFEELLKDAKRVKVTIEVFR